MHKESSSISESRAQPDFPLATAPADSDQNGAIRGGVSPALEASLNALVVIDRDGVVDTWNPSAEDIFGYSSKEAGGRQLAELIIPLEFRQAHHDGLKTYLQTGAAGFLNQTVKVQAMRRNGEQFPAMLTVSVLPGDGDLKFLGAIRDMSWQLVADSERQEIEERFRTLVEQLPVVVFIDAADAHMTPLYVSPQIEQLLGYSPEEWLADPDLWLKRLHQDDREEVCALALSWDFGPPFEYEYRMIHKDGKTVWVREETVTINDDHGKPRFSQGIFIDITSQKETEGRTREAETRYRSLVEQTPAITLRTSAESLVDVRYVSPQIESILGYKPDEWLANQSVFWTGIHPDDLARCNQAIHESHTTRKPLSLEFRQQARDGRYVWLSATIEFVQDDDGTPLFWQGVLIDVTERRKMEDAYTSLRDRYRHFADNANDAIIAIDLDGRFLFSNPAFHELTGFDEERLAGMKLSDLVDPDSLAHAREIATRLLTGIEDSTDRESLVLSASDGRTIIVEISASIVRSNMAPIGFQAILRDVTDRARLEAELEHQAHHDGLTNLPNRSRLLEQIWSWIESDDAKPGDNALIFLDLDNFKVINDSLGHDIGDLALVEVGKRIQHCLRGDDFVARFGGDEFVILLKRLNPRVSAADVAQRIVDRFDDPFHIAGREVKITASIGIADFSGDVERPEELLRRADLAMYRSKERGRNRYALHDETMDRIALDRLELETDLRRAIARNELTVNYQPVVFAGGRKISGAEALVRWVHPKRGLLSPGQFIPIAEDSGVIVQLDRWVLRTALEEVRSWPRPKGGESFGLSVNMSARQLDQDDLVSYVDELLDTLDVDVQLVFEITETAMMQDVDQAQRILAALHERGIRIALDDFGMGYSSLAQIRHLSIDYIKIDRQFIADISEQREDTIIVSGMIDLSHSLGLDVVAEGVETAAQADLLENLRCDFAQGYFYGYPCTSREFRDLLMEIDRCGDLAGPDPLLNDLARFSRAELNSASFDD